MVPCFLIGRRDAGCATQFVTDLASRLASRVQLTSDGATMYLQAVEAGFGGDVDYSMLVKHYESPREGEARYSPPVCVGCIESTIQGDPDKRKTSTSYVERQNLTIRMRNLRFTRLTNGFSKKVENHIAMLALHFMVYNFVTIHRTLRMPPALPAGVTDRVWSIEDVVGLVEAQEAATRRPGQTRPLPRPSCPACFRAEALGGPAEPQDAGKNGGSGGLEGGGGPAGHPGHPSPGKGRSCGTRKGCWGCAAEGEEGAGGLLPTLAAPPEASRARF